MGSIDKCYECGLVIFLASNLIKKRLQHRWNTCEICEIFKNTFFTEDPRWLLLSVYSVTLISLVLSKPRNSMCQIWTLVQLKKKSYIYNFSSTTEFDFINLWNWPKIVSYPNRCLLLILINFYVKNSFSFIFSRWWKFSKILPPNSIPEGLLVCLQSFISVAFVELKILYRIINDPSLSPVCSLSQ